MLGGYGSAGSASRTQTIDKTRREDRMVEWSG